MFLRHGEIAQAARVRFASMLPLASRRATFRQVMFAAAAVVLAPTVTVVTWTSLRAANEVRAQIETQAKQRAESITAVLDRQIDGLKSVLMGLSKSNYLGEPRDLDAFYEQASAVSRLTHGEVILADFQSGRLILNTAFARNAPLIGGFTVSQQQRHELAASSAPLISNLIFGPLMKRHVVAIGMHTVVEGSSYVLAVVVPADLIAEIVRPLPLGDQSIATIVDRNSKVLARSVRHSDFVGTTVPLACPDASNETGSSTGKNLEGVSFVWFCQRSCATGWIAAVGTPASVLAEPMRSAMFDLAGTSGMLALLAIGAGMVGHRLLLGSYGVLGTDRNPTRREFQILFDTAPYGVICLDSSGSIALVNERLAQMFGWRPDELVGQPTEVLLPERLRGSHVALRKAFVDAPQPRPMGAGRDLHGQRKDGSEFPIEIGLNPISTTGGTLIMATVVDITSRKQSEERLLAAISERDELRHGLDQAREQGRLRLAHELHDETGQALAGMMLELKHAEMSASDVVAERLLRVRRQLENMGKRLHRVAEELRPATLDDLGLEAAIATHLEEWTERNRIEVDFECRASDLDECSLDTSVVIYRVIQEALTNVAKHAHGAQAVSAVIERSGDMLAVTIEDDGIGFDLSETQTTNGRRGLGLPGMRERLSFVGGTIELESFPGLGTTLFVRVPLDQRKKSV